MLPRYGCAGTSHPLSAAGVRGLLRHCWPRYQPAAGDTVGVIEGLGLTEEVGAGCGLLTGMS